MTVGVIAVVSNDNGVGKTTVAANLCLALAATRRPVLAIDLDPQNQMRVHLLAGWRGCHDGWSRTLLAHRPFDEAVCIGHARVLVMPFGHVTFDDQDAIEVELAINRHWLRDVLRSFRLPADAVVVLDTPSGANVYLEQAMDVSSLNLVTVIAEDASLRALPDIERWVAHFCRPRSDFVGTSYMVNQVVSTSGLSAPLVSALRQRVGDAWLGVLHQDAAVGEALARSTTLFRHAPQSQAVHDVTGCAEHALQMLSDHSGTERFARRRNLNLDAPHA